MLQMVVRNYTPTDCKVAGDITTADSNYTILGFKLHAENGGASYAQATTSQEVSRKSTELAANTALILELPANRPTN